MNITQTQTSAATIIAFIAGILAGRGAFGFDQATWVTILTAIAGLSMTVWAAVANRRSAMTSTVVSTPEGKTEIMSAVAATPEGRATLVSTVANMSEVRGVTLDKTDPGTLALNASTPNNVVPQ